MIKCGPVKTAKSATTRSGPESGEGGRQQVQARRRHVRDEEPEDADLAPERGDPDRDGPESLETDMDQMGQEPGDGHQHQPGQKPGEDVEEHLEPEGGEPRRRQKDELDEEDREQRRFDDRRQEDLPRPRLSDGVVERPQRRPLAEVLPAVGNGGAVASRERRDGRGLGRPSDALRLAPARSIGADVLDELSVLRPLESQPIVRPERHGSRADAGDPEVRHALVGQDREEVAFKPIVEPGVPLGLR
jgi:hypothetical protein